MGGEAVQHEDGGPLPWLPPLGVAEAVALTVGMGHLQAQSPSPVPGGAHTEDSRELLTQHNIAGTGLNLLHIYIHYCKNPNAMWMVE